MEGHDKTSGYIRAGFWGAAGAFMFVLWVGFWALLTLIVTRLVTGQL